MQYPDGKDDSLTYDSLFKLMDGYFSKDGILFSHLYNSYDEFIENVISYIKSHPNIIFENKVDDKVYRYAFEFSNLFIRPPLSDNSDSLLYPMDARDNNITYSLKIYADVKQFQEIYQKIHYNC